MIRKLWKTLVSLLLAAGLVVLLINSSVGGEMLIGAADHPSLTHLLLTLGANPNARTQRMTPLIRAVERGNLQTIRVLAAHGADVDLGVRGKTPLHSAVMYEYSHYTRVTDADSPVHLLLTLGADPTVRPWGSKGGLTPVEMAARFGISETVERLLAHGAPVGNALFWAGDGPTAAVLLKHHAPVNARDPEGVTPLHCAAASSAEVVDLLLKAGADPRARAARTKATPLHALLGNSGYSYYGYHSATGIAVHAAQRLLAHGADPNARDSNGQTALHKAALNVRLPNEAKTEVAKVLLQHGADPAIRDARGNTALDYALDLRNNGSLIDLLER